MTHSYDNATRMAFRLACPEALADPEQRKCAANAISGFLYHTKRNFSGLISEEADRLRRVDKNFSPTREHYYSRAKCGYEIVDAIESGASFEEIKSLIIRASSVHYTTSDENNQLRKEKDLFWPHNYEKLKINLIPYVRLSQKYVYIVEEVEYNSAKEVAKKYNLSSAAVSARCKSKKYPDWIRKEV